MKVLVMILALIGFTATSFAEETMGEKVEVKAKTAKRAMKKGAHRIEEAVCMESDTKCLEKKMKHHAKEAGDAVGDKASEIKNKIDSEKK
ncbi:MAG: hypothetical protein WA160_12100 [Pseudobdellovibrio sp.]